MKVLSIRQPWASLIVKGCKDVENRTWKTDYRGPIAIHASGNFDWSFLDFEDWNDDPLQQYCAIVRDYFGISAKNNRITRNKQEIGAIIGTVDLADILTAGDAEAENNSIKSPWCFYEGFAWLFVNPKTLKNPIPCKGKLNLWNYD